LQFCIRASWPIFSGKQTGSGSKEPQIWGFEPLIARADSSAWHMPDAEKRAKEREQGIQKHDSRMPARSLVGASVASAHTVHRLDDCDPMLLLGHPRVAVFRNLCHATMFAHCLPATHRCNPHLSVRGLKKHRTRLHYHRSMGADAPALPAPAPGMIRLRATNSLWPAVAATGTRPRGT
jgi:hypothetical protein